MSLARQHRERTLAMQAASAPATMAGAAVAVAAFSKVAAATTPAMIAAQQIAMRLQHDLRRLKEIKSVGNKIAAKREMLPEYRAWIEGQLAATEAAGTYRPTGTPVDEVLPTIMVWLIDVWDWDGALILAAHVIRYDVPMPGRYQRDAATLLVEEVAEAALRAGRDDRVPLDILEKVEALASGIDMHDQPRAKLLKAIGKELATRAELTEGVAARPIAERAVAQLSAAQTLDDRIGVKTKIRGMERLLEALPPATDTGGDAG